MKKTIIRFLPGLAGLVVLLSAGCAHYEASVPPPAYPVEIQPYPPEYVYGPDIYVYGDVGRPIYGPHYEYWHRGVAPRHLPERGGVGRYHGPERGFGHSRHEHWDGH